jgi:hypothetical protein
MIRLLFVLVVCVNSVFAQQMTVIKDSVLLSVLDSFIDELKLEEKHYKIIRLGLVRFNQELNVESIDTTRVGTITGLRIDSKYEASYSFDLVYTPNSNTIDSSPVTYYAIYRKIPILMTTGMETLINWDQGSKRKLKRVIARSSSPDVLSYPIVWVVDITRKNVTITKSQ